MPLLISYSLKNVRARRLTTSLTVLGMGLVVFVFCAAWMLSHGLSETLVATGYDENAIVIRRSSQTEVQSILYRDQAAIIKTDPGVAVGSDGTAQFANEILVLITQPKRGTTGTGASSNVPVRGVSELSFGLRPNMKLVEGRMWRPGTSEIIAGRKVANGFEGCGLGEQVRFGTRDWTVVGVFESDGSGFESELWGDVEQLMDAFGRPVYSSLTFKLADTSQFAAVKARLEDDPRLEIDIDREKQYYANQSRFTSIYITAVGVTVSLLFGLGAIVGAMITMYAAVAGRTREIGTMRALGFSRSSILFVFLVESLTISMMGGALGIVVAYFLRFVEVSTTNWDTFAEIAFSFEMSPMIAVIGIIFSLMMGLVGGFLPSVRAARLKIIDALRSR